ncbi:MAG: hypothetical protein KH034_10160 [Lachnospiraceae bacterium]|nr:hypothetical protein [Lachnospiraceae bacterium]MDU3180327.1 hypothetical protein [Lachnospiraceae bacterium]
MKFYKNLYVGDSMKARQKEIVEKLETGKVQFSCYLIVLSNNPTNQLECYDSILLLQKRWMEEPMLVVGVASGYMESLEVIKQITEDAYLQYGDADLRRYILETQQEIQESKV